MTHVKPNKEQAIALLKNAIDRALEEQTHYHDTVQESMKLGPINHEKHCLLEGGSSELFEIMKDCSFPPCDDDRRQHLHLQWDQTLQHAKLSRIKDQDVRGYVSHLNRIAEHTQRIHAMAVFSERVCPLDEDGWRLFGSWAKHSLCTMLHQEAVEMGLESKQQALSAWLGVLPIIMDVHIGEERNTLAERCQQALKSKQTLD